MIESNIIGFNTSSKSDSFTVSVNPSTNQALPGKFSDANEDELNLAVDQASKAFELFKSTPGKAKAEFLNAVADEILALGDQLISRCCNESGLPEVRIIGERGRTIAQLQMFANLVEEGSWLEATIDTQQINREPVPKPDIRRMLIPLGPVVVFAASNFPLAFSHPGTSALIGSAIVNAAKKTGMPDGVFSLLHGSGRVVGQGLVKHPKIKAAGFTGSQKAGRLLYDIANQRIEPIPFFAEMGSVNPVLLLPSSLNNDTVKMLAGSITMGVGQFCTNPGLIISVDGNDLKKFISELADELSKIESGVMLNQQICNSYNSEIENLIVHEEITLEGRAEKSKNLNSGRALLSSVSEEIFGPSSLIVRCDNQKEVDEVLNTLAGQLTGSVIGNDSELSLYESSIKIMKKKVGRIIFNGVPTGVEVCPSMQHGGPYPASSDSRFTSVGTAAIKRFVRPISYQSWPNDKLPYELQDGNPLNIWRLVDGKLTQD